MDPNQVESEPIGDGKAAFFELGSDEEFEEYKHNEELGWGGFIKKIFNLSSKQNFEDKHYETDTE